MMLRRLLVLTALASGSLALLACSGAADGQGEGNPGAVAQPLAETCHGAYVCTADGTNETTSVVLERNGLGWCTAGEAVFQPDQKLTTDAGGHMVLGIWSGDSLAFDICNSQGCAHCKPEDTSVPGGTTNGSCTGSTSCSGHDPGSCSTHQGCSMHAHAVYSLGKFDHYDNECEGSTPSCSSHGTEDECKRQDCTWK